MVLSFHRHHPRTHGAVVASSVGCTVISPGVGGTAGTYTATLDAGVLGDGAVGSANGVFVMATALTALNNMSVTKTTVGGNVASVFTFVSKVGTTGVTTDGAFDFIIYRKPGG